MPGECFLPIIDTRLNVVRSHVQVGPGYPASALASCRSGIVQGRPRSSPRGRSSASFINSGAIDIFFGTNIPRKRLADSASAAARYCRHVATPSLQPTRCTRGRCAPCGWCPRAQDSSFTCWRCAGCSARPAATGSDGGEARRVEQRRAASEPGRGRAHRDARAHRLGHVAGRLMALSARARAAARGDVR